MRLAVGRLAGDNPEEEKKKRAGCWRLTLAESRSYIHQRPLPRAAHYSLISTRSPSQDIHTSGDRRRKMELGNGEMKMEEEVRMETKKEEEEKQERSTGEGSEMMGFTKRWVTWEE